MSLLLTRTYNSTNLFSGPQSPFSKEEATKAVLSPPPSPLPFSPTPPPWAFFTHLRKFLFLYIFSSGWVKILGIALIEAVNLPFLLNLDIFFYQDKFTQSLESWGEAFRKKKDAKRQKHSQRTWAGGGQSSCPVMLLWIAQRTVIGLGLHRKSKL